MGTAVMTSLNTQAAPARMRCWLLWLACVSVLAVSACSRTPSEAQLRGQVDALREAITARNAAQMSELLADDFIGPQGMDKREARRMAMGLFLRYPQVGVRTGPLTVQLQDQRHARVSFTVMATGGAGGLLPEQGQMHDVSTGWRVEGGQWKLVSAQWTPKL